jgi:hypothetical protein
MVVKSKRSVKRLPLSGAEPIFSYMGWGDVGRTRDNCYDYAFGDDEKRRVKSVPGDRSQKKFPNTNFTTCRGFVKRVLADNPKNVYKCTNPSKVCRRGYYKVMAFVAPTNIYGNSTGDFHWYKQHKAVRYRVRAGDTIAGLARFFKVTPVTIKNAIMKPVRPMRNDDGMIANSNMKIVMRQKGPLLKPGRVITFPVNAWSHKQGWATGPLMIDASGKLITDPRKANRNYGYRYSKFCSGFCVRAGRVNTGRNNV